MNRNKIYVVEKTVYKVGAREFNTIDEAKKFATITELAEFISIQPDYYFDSNDEVGEFIYRYKDEILEILNRGHTI